LKRKRLFYTILLILLPMLLLGCNLNLNFNGKKTNNFYYTNLLAKDLTLKTSYKCSVIDTNFYKEKVLRKEDADIIKKFTKALNKDSFIERPKDLPAKPMYKIIIVFDKEKYIVNVYNEKYISIFPWDGNFKMDYIDMSSLEASNNLFGLCTYLDTQ
jgi:hypothetical protein